LWSLSSSTAIHSNLSDTGRETTSGWIYHWIAAGQPEDSQQCLTVWNPSSGSVVSKATRWKPQMTKAKAYRVVAERLRAYAQKPEAADYVDEFEQLAKCYRILAESTERKTQFDWPHYDLPPSKRVH
jgi:hypothetical protein